MPKPLLKKLDEHAVLSEQREFFPQQKFVSGWPTDDDPRNQLPDYIVQESKQNCWHNADHYVGGEAWYEATKRFRVGRIITVKIISINKHDVDVQTLNGAFGKIYLTEPIPELRVGQQKTARVVINNPFLKRLVLQLQKAVRISYLSFDCTGGMLQQPETKIPAIQVRSYQVTNQTDEKSLFKQLGQDCFVKLAHIWQLLVHQGNGQTGGLLNVEEAPNNFFVKDCKKQIWSVRLMWVNHSYEGGCRGWEVLALPHNSKRLIEPNTVFFAKEHEL